LKDLGGKVSPALATQRAGVDDPGVGHGFDRSSNVFKAALAGDDKVTDAGSGSVKHAIILGEEKANKVGQFLLHKNQCNSSSSSFTTLSGSLSSRSLTNFAWRR